MFTINNDSILFKSGLGSYRFFDCVAGGTLYCSIPTPEVAARVMRGLRPPHLSHVSDDLYQLMLQCWQLDLDERPSFSEIASTLCDLINSGEVSIVLTY